VIGIVIVAHGGFAREYLATVEHILGRQTAMRAISIGVQENRTEKMREIALAADAVDTGNGVVVVTDIFGGSPANLALPSCNRKDRRMIYGANLPALLKLIKKRDRPLDEAVALAVAAGRKHLDCVDVFCR
jgi:PTS system mannose-specific IIA component